MENVMNRKTNVPRFVKIIGWVIGGIALAVLLAFLFGYFVMLLWNWLMPELFGLPMIDYWMAIGIIILAKLLFGGFGHGSHDKHKSEHHSRFSKSKFAAKCKSPKEASKWKHYHEYWKEEGEEAFGKFLERKQTESKLPETEKPAE